MDLQILTLWEYNKGILILAVIGGAYLLITGYNKLYLYLEKHDANDKDTSLQILEQTKTIEQLMRNNQKEFSSIYGGSHRIPRQFASALDEISQARYALESSLLGEGEGEDYPDFPHEAQPANINNPIT